MLYRALESSLLSNILDLEQNLESDLEPDLESDLEPNLESDLEPPNLESDLQTLALRYTALSALSSANSSRTHGLYRTECTVRARVQGLLTRSEDRIALLRERTLYLEAVTDKLNQQDWDGDKCSAI